MVDFEHEWENDVIARLTALDKKLDKLANLIVREPAVSSGARATPTPTTVATDEDLDGKYGDPEAKWCPRKYRMADGRLMDYEGKDYTGRRFSECSADFLLGYAGDLEYAADHPKPGKEKYAEYNRRDAARARGWSARRRDAIPDSDPNNGEETCGDIPF